MNHPLFKYDYKYQKYDTFDKLCDRLPLEEYKHKLEAYNLYCLYKYDRHYNITCPKQPFVSSYSQSLIKIINEHIYQIERLKEFLFIYYFEPVRHIFNLYDVNIIYTDISYNEQRITFLLEQLI